MFSGAVVCGKRERDGCSRVRNSRLCLWLCASDELPHSIYDPNNPHTCFLSIPSLAAIPPPPALAIMALPVEDNKNDAAASQAIKGNLPPKVKHMLDSVLHELMARPNVFGAAIGERIVITEVSTVPKAEESSRSEARVVCEVTVAEGSSVPKLHMRLNRNKTKNFTLGCDAGSVRLHFLNSD